MNVIGVREIDPKITFVLFHHSQTNNSGKTSSTTFVTALPITVCRSFHYTVNSNSPSDALSRHAVRCATVDAPVRDSFALFEHVREIRERSPRFSNTARLDNKFETLPT